MKKLDIENENNSNPIAKIKASFSGRKFRSGAYVMLTSVIVIVILLVANMLISKMNIQIDLSSRDMYTLTDDTVQLVEGLSDDITIYYLTEAGNETEIFHNIAKKYDSISDKITLESKDPVLYPNFAATYVEDEVRKDSFIVVNNTTGAAKYVDSSDLLVQEVNYQTYQSETTGIDVEGELTSAILYVTTEDIPVMYVVGGHGEVATGETFNETFNKMNVSIQTLDTLTQSSIPEDCDILYINAPQSDFSEDETVMIKDYLMAGGKAIITLDYNSASLSNFLSILNYYGVEMVKGIVIEGNSSMHLSNYPHYLVPNIESSDITSNARRSDIPVLMPISSGLLISDTLRSTLTVKPLLSTSEDAYVKRDPQFKTVEKEDGDTDGPVYLGLVASETYNGIVSDVIVYSTGLVFDEGTSVYGNNALLTGTVGYLIGEADTLSIPTKSVTPEYITLTQMQAFSWGFVVVIIIPLLILITGAVVVLKRRKK